MSDHDLILAERAEDRAQADADAFDAAFGAEVERIRDLMQRPLDNNVAPLFGTGAARRQLSVPIGIDFAGWLSEMAAPDISTAWAMFCPHFRASHVEQYARERAELVVLKRGAA
jgi:hypothetical protein